MILGVNGIRLVAARSGVARCIEAILGCLDELQHPFTEIRVYTPSPLEGAIALPRGMPEWLTPLVAIVPAQLFCYHLTQAKGYDTEAPRSIRKVTLTK